MTENLKKWIEVEAPYCISAWQYVRLVSVDVGIASCPPSAEEYQVVTDVALEGRAGSLIPARDILQFARRTAKVYTSRRILERLRACASF